MILTYLSALLWVTVYGGIGFWDRLKVQTLTGLVLFRTIKLAGKVILSIWSYGSKGPALSNERDDVTQGEKWLSNRNLGLTVLAGCVALLLTKDGQSAWESAYIFLRNIVRKTIRCCWRLSAVVYNPLKQYLTGFGVIFPYIVTSIPSSNARTLHSYKRLKQTTSDCSKSIEAG